MLTLLVLIFIIGFVLEKGLRVISFEFLFSNAADMGRAGGIVATVVGTVILPLFALLLAAPLGIGTAVYLTEYSIETKVCLLYTSPSPRDS